MPLNHDEIIEDLEGNIRKCGGGFGEWCVGTAKDLKGASLRSRHEQAPDERLIYREAYTPYAAAEAVERRVEGYGLRADPGSASGRVVYVYRASVPAPAAASATTATTTRAAMDSRFRGNDVTQTGVT